MPDKEPKQDKAQDDNRARIIAGQLYAEIAKLEPAGGPARDKLDELLELVGLA